MTPERLEEIELRAAAATREPWHERRREGAIRCSLCSVAEVAAFGRVSTPEGGTGS